MRSTSHRLIKICALNMLQIISLFAVLMSVNAEECTLMKPIVAVVLSALYDSAFSVKDHIQPEQLFDQHVAELFTSQENCTTIAANILQTLAGVFELCPEFDSFMELKDNFQQTNIQ
ncbi:hypothetical protein CSKR_200214 [Clonorchis sinensis]|uniref:Uncharacterized protein n=1 Tax=Clonorchis sinensis TaxID=79923 RepID=A0A8T1M0F6_CLOSI|nr:hypothetical protein CSKR_200214 [Clonorchis sinensis]